MTEYKTYDYKKKRKLQRVIGAYLQHKGIKADEYSFTTKLFKEPDFRVCGFNIAFEVTRWNNKDVCYFSLICSTTQKIN